MTHVPLEERTTPRTGAESEGDYELDEDNLEELREQVNATANQTIEGNVQEVQGKLAVPHAKVMKRGQTKWTDEAGVLHKELNDAEANVYLGEAELPQYLKLHQEILEGANPLEATLEYQGKDPAEDLVEGKLQDAELHPRTHGLGPVTQGDNR